MLERVTTKVASIAQHVENVNTNGGLKVVNAIYKQAPIPASGARIKPCEQAVARRRRALLEHAAAGHQGKLGREICGAVSEE